MSTRSVTNWILLILIGVSALLAVSLLWLDFTATKRILRVAHAERLAVLQRQTMAMLEQDKGALASLAFDYSAWDAAHDFALGQNADFVRSDLGDTLNESLDVDHYAYFRPDGSLLLASSMGPDGLSVPTDDKRVEALRRLALTPMATEIRSQGMLIMFAGKPALAGVSRLLRTDLNGPEAGRVVLVRLFEGQHLQAYREVLAAPLEIVWAGSADTQGLTWFVDEANDVDAASLALLDQGAAHGKIRLQSEDQLTPRLLVATREVWMFGLLGGLLALAIVSGWLWRRVALPLRELRADVRSTSDASDLSRRVRVSTAFSEVEALSVAMNQLLDERQRRHELDREQEAERRAAQLKSRFLATMSHEIRTPLSGVLGAIDMLRRHPGEDTGRYLVMAEQASQHLLQLINDVLDFSRIEAGQFNLRCEPVSLSELIDQSVAVVRQRAEAKRLQVIADTSGASDHWLNVDSVRIRQVLINLLSNAVKFSHDGVIQVTVEDSADWIQVHVLDQGIGIPPDRLDEVFIPFRQLDNSLSGEHGTGLGLAISRELARMHGGELQAAIREGGGTAMTLRLPAQSRCQEPAVKAAVAGSERLAELAHQRILIAEDDELSRLLVIASLSHIGYQVDAVDNGMAAVLAAKAQLFDLILMDRHMPDCDGIEAARQIRNDEHSPNRFTPIIALTASTLTEDRDACLAVGMNDFIGKPITPMQLEGLVADMLRRHRPAQFGRPSRHAAVS